MSLVRQAMDPCQQALDEPLHHRRHLARQTWRYRTLDTLSRHPLISRKSASHARSVFKSSRADRVRLPSTCTRSDSSASLAARTSNLTRQAVGGRICLRCAGRVSDRSCFAAKRCRRRSSGWRATGCAVGSRGGGGSGYSAQWQLTAEGLVRMWPINAGGFLPVRVADRWAGARMRRAVV